MTRESFLRAYPHYYPDMSGLDGYYIISYLRFSHYWNEPFHRHDVKRLFKLLKKVYKRRYFRDLIRKTKFAVLHPKIDIMLDMPGFLMGLAVLLLTFGRIEADWLLYDRWKAWAVLLLIIAGIWYW